MTAAANSDARKRLAEQQADTTLVDILDAYFYSQNSVNWHRRHAEAVAALVAEHYGAVVAAERERALGRGGHAMSSHRIHWQPGVEEIVAREKAKAWDEGHRDVCTDCNCPPHINPYRAHEHEWRRRQNVTSRGYVMPAIEVCACGIARTLADPKEKP